MSNMSDGDGAADSRPARPRDGRGRAVLAAGSPSSSSASRSENSRHSSLSQGFNYGDPHGEGRDTDTRDGANTGASRAKVGGNGTYGGSKDAISGVDGSADVDLHELQQRYHALKRAYTELHVMAMLSDCPVCGICPAAHATIGVAADDGTGGSRCGECCRRNARIHALSATVERDVFTGLH